ncbi:MAG: glucosaminidase domain-containing protein [Pseudomonadota bacterium]
MQTPVDNKAGMPLLQALKDPGSQGVPGQANAPGSTDDAKLNEAATAFEGAFLKILLKSMRQTIPEGGLFDRQQMAAFEEMRDGALADSLAGRGATGIAQMVVAQLGGKPQQPQPAITLTQGVRPAQSVNVSQTPETSGSSAGERQRFVDQLMPVARRAASALGIDAAVIVAQAALETGWGKHVPTRAGGGTSHNLFGVKASAGWQGPTSSQTTTEFLGGKLREVVASFRAYASPAESVSDYVNLIRSSGRYAAAAGASSPDAYLKALEDGGYATDPNYARKIKAILGGQELRSAHDN